MSRLGAIFQPVSSHFGRLLQFLTSQGLTLVANVAYGILCVRLLPASEYAKFVVLFGAIGTLVTLMDINFSGTLIPLIGSRTEDRSFIADYVASLRRLSYILFGLLGAATIVLYPAFVRHRGWPWPTVCVMMLFLLVSCWFLRLSATYGTVLILFRDRTLWYRGQMISSFGTLLLLFVLWTAKLLNGMTAISLNVIGIIFLGCFYYLRATSLLGQTGRASRGKQRDIVRLAAPNVPQAIFFALQGQIALFLITYFGRTTAVASVGGLSRLSQLFMLFMQMNPILIEPYFAKLKRQHLRRSYFAVVVAAAVFCTAVIFLAAQVPELFLWVLGAQYRGLKKEVVLVIAASGVSCFSGVLWAIHSARRFVYWGSNVVNILLILTVQVSFILKGDLTMVRVVLWITLASNVVTLLVNIGTGVYGFVKGPRQVKSENLFPVESMQTVAAADEAGLQPSEAAEARALYLEPKRGAS